MAEVTPPIYTGCDGDCYTPQQLRQQWESVICEEGVDDTNGTDSLLVTDGAASGMTVDVLPGGAWIEGDEVADQGMYYVRNDATVTLTHAASDPTDPRIDIVVAHVHDAQYSGTECIWELEIITGSPSPAPVPPSAPANSITLAEVLIPAGATEITPADITDTREHYVLCDTAVPVAPPPTVQVFSSDGTWDKPANARYVRVSVVGGGGGGGAGTFTGASEGAAGGGGGGGGYAESLLAASAVPSSVSVVVGTGGAGSGTSSPGGSGGTSSFDSLVATGGAGGTSMTATSGNSIVNGGSGGAGSGGNVVNDSGGRGEAGEVVGGFALAGGYGGDAAGGEGLGGYFNNAGLTAGGGGGGGRAPASSSSVSGGTGARGEVRVEVYF